MSFFYWVDIVSSETSSVVLDTITQEVVGVPSFRPLEVEPPKGATFIGCEATGDNPTEFWMTTRE